jgi:hypothetical protein
MHLPFPHSRGRKRQPAGARTPDVGVLLIAQRVPATEYFQEMNRIFMSFTAFL